LWVMDAVLAVGGVCLVGALLFRPLDAGPVCAEPSPERVAPRPERAPVLPLEAYAAVYERDLQRPLYDPSPVPAPAAKPPPAPDLRLVGTVIEPDNTFALLRTRRGEVKWARIGEALEGAEVVEIESEAVTVRFKGVDHQLAIEKKESP